FFKLDLDADSVPNLEPCTDGDDGRGVDENFEPDWPSPQDKYGMGREVSQFRPQHPQADDGDEKRDLPVKAARHRQIAPNPAVDAEVDKRREVPDLFLIGSKCAQLAGY